MTDRCEIQFRTKWDSQSEVSLPTVRSIHAVRKAARRALVRLEALRTVVGRGSYGRLRKSLHRLIRMSAQSRDTEVQRQIIVQLALQMPKTHGRACDELLLKLGSRSHKAVRRLAGKLGTDKESEFLRRMNDDLDALRFAESVVDLPWLARPHLRHALKRIYGLLGQEITPDRLVHRLRIRVRRAHCLGGLVNTTRIAGLEAISHDLKRLQGALGDLHDLMLLRGWIKKRGLIVAPSLGLALDAVAKDRLQKCERWRKPLRRAIRQLLEKTRE